MRTSSIRPGDIVYASKRGRSFHAKVVEVDAAGSLLVEPIERNISYRHLQASEITEHWSRSSSTRRAAREPKAQATLELRSCSAALHPGLLIREELDGHAFRPTARPSSA